jgi:hypothetical protein
MNMEQSPISGSSKTIEEPFKFKTKMTEHVGVSVDNDFEGKGRRFLITTEQDENNEALVLALSPEAARNLYKMLGRMSGLMKENDK